MLLLVTIFLTETQTCIKRCVFVMSHACTRNIKPLLRHCCWIIRSCCIVYSWNMLHYVWIFPLFFSSIKVFYFLFVSLLHNKDDQSVWCCYFFIRCFLNFTSRSFIRFHSFKLRNSVYVTETNGFWAQLTMLSCADKLLYITS